MRFQSNNLSKIKEYMLRMILNQYLSMNMDGGI